MRASVLPLTTAAIALWGVAATVWLAGERAVGLHGALALAVVAGAVAAALVAARRFGTPLSERARAVAERAARIPVARWLVGCIAAGWALRLAWIAAFPPVQRSDWLAYFELGAGLAERGVYAWRDIHVYLPPGLPMALAALFKVTGVHAWVPWVLNLAVFAAAVVVVHRLSAMIAGEGVARLATILLVVWPNLVMMAGLAMKENLTLLLLPVGVLLYLESAGAEDRWRCGLHAAAAGIVLGFAALAQPSILPLPVALLAWEIVRRGRWRGAALRLALVAVAMAAVIAPWTARNWVRFGRFVPVAANGGHSLMVGNNPDADGGWIPIRDRYPHDDEVAYDRMALRLGLDWMRRNPGRVAVLAVFKQRLFLGDDADGAYETLRRLRGIGGVRYLLAKGASLAFWILLLWLVATALWRRRGAAVIHDSRLHLPMVILLYFFALHSVMESGGRHHVGLAGFLVLFAALTALPTVANSRRPSRVAPGSRS